MALDAAVGSYAAARDNLRNTLAASETFQTWTGSGSAAAAKARIHLSAVPPPAGDTFTVAELAALLPLAVLYTKDFRSTKDSAGAPPAYVRGGSLEFELVGPVDAATADNPAECGRKFDNVVSQIIEDLEAANGTSGCLAWSTLLLEEEPERGKQSDLPVRGDLFRVWITVTWRGQ